MFSLVRLVWLLSTGPFFAVAQPAPATLVNPSFETPGNPPVGWSQTWGTVAPILDTDVFRSAPASLRIDCQAGGGVAQMLKVPAGHRFTVGAWVRSEGRGKTKLIASFLDLRGKALKTFDLQDIKGAMDWRYQEIEIVSPPETSALALTFSGHEVRAWLDDVTLTSPSVKVVIHNPAPATNEDLPEPEPADPTLIPTTPVRGFFPSDQTLWMRMHHENCALAAERGQTVDLVLLGDSITSGWGTRAAKPHKKNAAVWNRFFGAYRTLNLGIGGDKTQNVLWRIEHGELEGLTPKMVILAVGVNNAWDLRVPPAAVAHGVKRCVERLREKLPNAKILVVNVFPVHELPEDPERQRVQGIRAAIRESGVESGDSVHLVDLGSEFLDARDRIPADIMMPDFLHLSTRGYERFAEALAPLVTNWLGR